MHEGARPNPYRGRLRTDPSFYLEQKFCNEHGLPHSEFLEWDPSDRAKALAFEIEESLRCAMCGTAQWQWDENRYAFEVVPHDCPGCYQKEYLQDSADKRPGRTLELQPTGTMESARRHLSEQRRYERSVGK